MLEKDQSRMNQEGELQFKPLTEGLGFQPFSDGLPYAPLSKNTKSPFLSTTGAGASVAGPHRFHSGMTQNQRTDQEGYRKSTNDPLASEIRTSQKSSLQIPAPPVHPSFDAGTLMTSVRTPSMRSGRALLSPQVQVPTHSLLSGEESLSLGEEESESSSSSPIMKRVLAYLIDLGFNSLLMSSILVVTFWFYEIEFQVVQHSSLLSVAIAFLAFTNWVLVLLQEVVFKTSLGKYFLRLVLTGGRGQIFIRGIFFLGSVALGGFGLIWALFDPNRACLHDRLLGSQPEEMKNFN